MSNEPLKEQSPPALHKPGPPLKIIKPAEIPEDYTSYPLATFNQRAVAIILDGLFCGIIVGLFNGLMSHALGHTASPLEMGPRILRIVVFVIYYIFPVYASGETLGKRLMGVRVVSDNEGGQLGFLQVLGRETIGRLISVLPLGLGYLGAAQRKDRKTFHDRIFSTRVVTFR